MARVKDTRLQAGAAVIPAAGKKVTNATKAKAQASKAKEEPEAIEVKQSKHESPASNEKSKTNKKLRKAELDVANEGSSKTAKPKEKSLTKDSKASKPSESKGKKRKSLEEEDTIKLGLSTDEGAVKKQKRSAKQVGSKATKNDDSNLEGIRNATPHDEASAVVVFPEHANEAVHSKPKGSKTTTKTKKSAKSAANAQIETEAEEATNAAAVEEQEEDEWEPEDEIAQLITGFETASEDEESGDEGFQQGKAIPKLPKQKALTAKERKGNSSDKPGVIYIGRVPHGFHEHEMRAYFSQFGEVNHVRLSRSKRTGRSKHYAFLEFKSEEVAKIAAKTMDRYLLFGHILRCSFVPQEQAHPSLWKGADKRFKSVPWAKIEGRKLAAPKGRTEWQQKVKKESKRRANRADKLKAIGYDFEPTKLKDVDSVPMQIAKQLEVNVTEEEKTIVVGKDGDSIVVSEEIKTKKVKSSKKASKSNELVAGPSELSHSPDDGKRIKKPSKRALEALEAGPEPKKAKTDKKSH